MLITSTLQTTIENSSSRFQLNESKEEIEQVWFFLQVIGFVLLMVVSIAGNSIVMIIIIKDRRLRSYANIFIVSLAGSDLLVSTCVVPLQAVYHLLKSWPFGHVLCSIFVIMDVLCCTASIMNLCAISLDRYWAIVTPFAYPSRMTNKTCFAMIAGVWVCSAIIAFAQLLWRYALEEVSKHSGGTTDDEQCLISKDKFFRVFSSMTSFYLPLIVMLFTYSKIYRVARKQLKSISKQSQSARIRQASLENEDTDNSSNHPYHKFNRSKSLSVLKRTLTKGRGALGYKPAREMKAFKTLSMVMGLFIIAWLPFFVVYLIQAFLPQLVIPSEVEALVLWAGYVNSAVNPGIYFFINRSYRRAFMRLFFSSRERNLYSTTVTS